MKYSAIYWLDDGFGRVLLSNNSTFTSYELTTGIKFSFCWKCSSTKLHRWARETAHPHIESHKGTYTHTHINQTVAVQWNKRNAHELFCLANYKFNECFAFNFWFSKSLSVFVCWACASEVAAFDSWWFRWRFCLQANGIKIERGLRE